MSILKEDYIKIYTKKNPDITPINYYEKDGDIIVFNHNITESVGRTINHRDKFDIVNTTLIYGEPIKTPITLNDLDIIYNLSNVIFKITLIIICILKIIQIIIKKNISLNNNQIANKSANPLSKSSDNGDPSDRKNNENKEEKGFFSDIYAFGQEHKYKIAFILTTLLFITSIYLYSSSSNINLSEVSPIVNEIVTLNNNNDINLTEFSENTINNTLLEEDNIVDIDNILKLQEEAIAEMDSQDKELNEPRSEPSSTSSNSSTTTYSLLDLAEPEKRPSRKGRYIQAMRRKVGRGRALDEESLKNINSILKKKK